MRERIYLSPPFMNGNEMKYIQEAFDSNWIAPVGPNVDAFEQDVCEYVGVKYGLALSSGTAGIHLALKYVGVGPGDYVFCSDLTFMGSCNPILYEDAIPIFIDSEPLSWNMCPDALERAFEWASKESKLPKAVIIVDLYGQSADYDRLIPICEHYGVPIIEDAAEALGASYKGKKCGSLGYIGVFSFNGNKIITTSGGGMVVSNDEDAIKKMRFWATQSRENTNYYEHKEIGYNYRMSNVCAGIGRGQIELLEEKIKGKTEIYNYYKELIKNYPFSLMPIANFSQPNYWLTVITIENEKVKPEKIISLLESHNIESRHMWKPMHIQPLLNGSLIFTMNNNAVGQVLYEKGVCLPSGNELQKKDQDYIIDLLVSTLL